MHGRGGAARAGATQGRAPRPHAFGFAHWRGHDAALWTTLVDEARERGAVGVARLRDAAPGQVIRGSDRDARALAVARACVERAGLSGLVALERADLAAAGAPAAHGLLTTNTPYGERLGEQAEAEALCRLLGERLRAGFGGWRAASLTGGPRLAAAVGVPVKRQTTLYNGPLACTLVLFEPASARAKGSSADASGSSRADAAPSRDARPSAAAGPAASGQRVTAGGAAGHPPHAPGLLSGGAEQFANRLHKNRRNLARLVRREELTCYRLYDADLPDYNMVVDVYGDRVHVQEYAAPAEIDPGKVRRRLEDALAVVAAELDVPPARIVLKQRRRQRGPAQYGRRAAAGDFFPVAEDGLTYLVNLEDYLDTGLFIDQRLTRRLIRGLAGGARFLNLFAYTGTMTVNALAAGAPTSTTVDISATYLEWAQRNLAANGFSAELPAAGPTHRGAAGPSTRGADGPSHHGATRPSRRGAGGPDATRPAAHRLVQADCLRWLAEAGGDFDLIWLDPPTFSNSKRMGAATFDVQRDHADLIRMTARRLLAPGGVLLFATNRRNFRLDRAELGGLQVKDLSRATLPPDCARAANRHYVFRIAHSA